MIKYVTPVRRSAAGGGTATVYEQMSREFGVHAEPIVLHSPAPEVMFGVWGVCRESLVAEGHVERPVKEAVATAVSSINSCPFCVDAHASMLSASDRLHDAERIGRGDYDAVADPELGRAVEWAVATRTPGAAALREPPFGPDAAPEMISTALMFHYINRTVSVFCGDSPFPFGGRVLRRWMLRLAGRRFRPFASSVPPAGASLALLPESGLPADLDWVSDSPVLAGAWARFVGALERAGESALPPAAREITLEALEGWRGEEMPLHGGWIDQRLDGLTAARRPAARLSLLAALAPYRVDAAVIDAYRNGRADAEVVGAVAWPALAAARRIGAWVARPA
jgi:AhpD family alkylhydroperoxidase